MMTTIFFQGLNIFVIILIIYIITNMLKQKKKTRSILEKIQNDLKEIKNILKNKK